jgi:hypothetical protein
VEETAFRIWEADKEVGGYSRYCPVYAERGDVLRVVILCGVLGRK